MGHLTNTPQLAAGFFIDVVDDRTVGPADASGFLTLLDVNTGNVTILDENVFSIREWTLDDEEALPQPTAAP